jgi:trans-L-3-hydroxyproline dehydratase
MLARRRFARAHCDDLRRALMWEPRGHADMYGCVLTPPATPDGDAGVLFMHNEGFSTMCGHGVIALTVVGVETGLLHAAEDDPAPVVRLDTPAGRVVSVGRRRGGRVERASFENVPSFVLARDLVVDVPGLGRVRCDIAFGGAFYAYVDADLVDLPLEPAHVSRIIEFGRRISDAVARAHPIVHPAGDADLNFLYGTIFVSRRLSGPGVHSRNVCVFGDGEVDRSPTGTGVSGRAALHVARGELQLGETLTIESLIGTTFTVRAVRETRVADLPAVIPEVSGAAHLVGRCEFVIDPDDPLRGGFLLR